VCGRQDGIDCDASPRPAQPRNFWWDECLSYHTAGSKRSRVRVGVSISWSKSGPHKRRSGRKKPEAFPLTAVLSGLCNPRSAAARFKVNTEYQTSHATLARVIRGQPLSNRKSWEPSRCSSSIQEAELAPQLHDVMPISIEHEQCKH